MSVTYLAVDDAARDLIERLSPVYGAKLEDGRVVAKVRGIQDDMPSGVEAIGVDAERVRRDIYEPPARGGKRALQARAALVFGGGS